MTSDRNLDHVFPPTAPGDLYAWAAAALIHTPGSRVNNNTLYTAYLDWCAQRGLTPVGRRRFINQLLRKGACIQRSNGQSYILDITFTATPAV